MPVDERKRGGLLWEDRKLVLLCRSLHICCTARGNLTKIQNLNTVREFQSVIEVKSNDIRRLDSIMSLLS